MSSDIGHFPASHVVAERAGAQVVRGLKHNRSQNNKFMPGRLRQGIRPLRPGSFSSPLALSAGCAKGT
jgi:hypothetical protein